MFSQKFPNDLNGIIFDRQRLRRVDGQITLGTAAGLFVEVARLKLDAQDHGYLTAYSNEVATASFNYDGSSIRFRILVNESPVDDCNDFYTQRGTSSSPAEALYYVQPGSLIQLLARRVATAMATNPVIMGAVIQTWPQQLAATFPKNSTLDASTRRLAKLQ